MTITSAPQRSGHQAPRSQAILVGGPQSVVVHADSNLISNVTTGVVDGTLVIADTGSFTTRSPMNVDVSVPSLAALTLSGDGQQLSVTGISGAAADRDHTRQRPAVGVRHGDPA